MNGAGGGIRTHDLLFTKQLLYQLSYSGEQYLIFERMPLVLVLFCYKTATLQYKFYYIATRRYSGAV